LTRKAEESRFGVSATTVALLQKLVKIAGARGCVELLELIEALLDRRYPSKCLKIFDSYEVVIPSNKVISIPDGDSLSVPYVSQHFFVLKRCSALLLD
jgi:hypothetical protein